MAIPETTTTHNINHNNNTVNILSNQQYTKILDMEETLQMKKNKNQSFVTNQVDLKKENTIIGNNSDNDPFRKFQHEFLVVLMQKLILLSM